MFKNKTYSLPLSIPGTTYLFAVLPVLILLVLINTLIDYWQSVTNNYAFYWSESILFGSHWWFYAPILYLQVFYFKRMGKLSWFNRIMMVSLPILIHVLVYPAMVCLFSWLFFSHTYAFGQVLGYGIPSYLLQMVVVYSVPLIWVWLKSNKDKVRDENTGMVTGIIHPALADTPDCMIVQDGQKHCKIRIEQVLYFSANHPYINIHLLQKKYLHKETLRSVAERLHSSGFIRVHRSAVVNITAVKSYRSRTNGDYDLELIDGSSLRMSRSYAGAFLHAYHPLT